MTALAGALRSTILRARSGPLPRVVRVFVPVDLRPPNDPQQLGNRFATALVPLPIRPTTPLERFRVLQREMNRVKRSLEPVVAFGITNILGMVPRWLEHVVLRLFAQKASGTITNVPGPSEPIAMAGARLGSIMFWVPQICDSALGVSILTYAGEVIIGVTTDEAVLDDPQAIADAVLQELDTLIALGRACSG